MSQKLSSRQDSPNRMRAPLAASRFPSLHLATPDDSAAEAATCGPWPWAPGIESGFRCGFGAYGL